MRAGIVRGREEFKTYNKEMRSISCGPGRARRVEGGALLRFFIRLLRKRIKRLKRLKAKEKEAGEKPCKIFKFFGFLPR